MPEGDTVHLAATRLHAALAGRVLTRTDFRVPAFATSDLSGQVVREVVARGKHLLFRTDANLTLHTHFKMDGSWRVYRPGQRWQGPDFQVRAVLENAERVAVGFRLAVVELLPTRDESRVVGQLGPDVLGPDWDPQEALRRLWAADRYATWTGDEAFEHGPGQALFVETARYWASRIRLDREARGHIYGVIGPDEYHEPVDDNAFTNVMAGWNLRRGAQALARDGHTGARRESWLSLAASLVDGYDPSTQLYEQFTGFWGLEPLIIEDVAPSRPVAADQLLGADRVAAAQVLKQADVLMLHHMVPDAVAPGSLVPNLEFYEPRTAHGSSLSPGVHASLFAQAGRPSDALEALRLAACVDLDDLTKTTAGGLHLATLGSAWQAIVFGFVGVQASGRVPRVEPRIPERWDTLEIPLRFRGSRIRLRMDQDTLHVWAERPTTFRVGGDAAGVDVGAAGARFRRSGTHWDEVGR